MSPSVQVDAIPNGASPVMKSAIPALLMPRTSVETSMSDFRVRATGVCVAAAFLFCYAPVLLGMVRQWWNISFYSYAFLVPIVSAYLVWIRRDQLLAVKPEPHYTGGSILVIGGLSALIVGRAGGIQAIEQVSLLITLPGIVVVLFGLKALKLLILPIGFLWFMLPIWESITDPLHFPFQQFSADLGVLMLRLVGIPVYQDGVFIYLPNITLEVAKACSGINYLIAVLATSIPLATIVLTGVWRRILLVLLAMAVSAFANSLRVALIGVLAYYDLSGDLHGPYHMLHGVFVSFIGYAAIFAGLWVLSRGQRAFVRGDGTRMWRLGWGQVRTAWIVLAVVLGLVGVSRYVERSHPVPLMQDLSELSLENAGWTGIDIPSAEGLPGVDQSLSRSYRAVSGEEVQVSFWYFERQSQGKELVNPRTSALHADAKRVRLNIVGQGAVELNRRVVHREGHTNMVVFWYDVNGRILASQLAVKCYTMLDAVVYGRTNGALVSIAVDLLSDDEAGKEQAIATLEGFVSTLYLALDRYLPNPAGGTAALWGSI